MVAQTKKNIIMYKKLTDREIDELIRIVETSYFYEGIGIGEEPNLCSDECETYWKSSETNRFDIDTLSNLKQHLKNFSGFVFLFPMGTHCGCLVFQTGWVHEDGTTNEMNNKLLLKSIKESIKAVLLALLWVIYAGIAVAVIGYAAANSKWWLFIVPLFQILLVVIHFVYGENKRDQEREIKRKDGLA